MRYKNKECIHLLKLFILFKHKIYHLTELAECKLAQKSKYN